MLAPTVYVEISRHVSDVSSRSPTTRYGLVFEAVLGPLRLSLVGLFHDGCLAPHGAWQCLLDRLRPDQTDRPFRSTLIAGTAHQEEIAAIVAHELGHFLHRDFPRPVARRRRRGLLVVASRRVAGWLTKQPWLLPAFGVGSRGRCARSFSSACCSPRSSARGSAPIGNWISRRAQYQADDYARPHGRRRADGERADPARA